MIAEIVPSEDGYIARYERHWQHPAHEVWSYLTDNDRLKRWFSELRIEDLREGGSISFDMQDGTFEHCEITALNTESILAFTWGEDSVRFELYPAEEGGCRLVFIEEIGRLTEHTPKDLAGWHVCLDLIADLLDGRTLESREDEWEAWYERYREAVAKVQKN